MDHGTHGEGDIREYSPPDSAEDGRAKKASLALSGNLERDIADVRVRLPVATKAEA